MSCETVRRIDICGMRRKLRIHRIERPRGGRWNAIRAQLSSSCQSTVSKSRRWCFLFADRATIVLILFAFELWICYQQSVVPQHFHTYVVLEIVLPAETEALKPRPLDLKPAWLAYPCILYSHLAQSASAGLLALKPREFICQSALPSASSNMAIVRVLWRFLSKSWHDGGSCSGVAFILKPTDNTIF